MSYRVLQKETIRVASRDTKVEPNFDVTYVAELDEDRLRTLAISAHRNRNGMAVDGPVRVRILKREKFQQ